jgi:hypothetical protein
VFDAIDDSQVQLTMKKKAWIKANYDTYTVRVVVSDNAFWRKYVMPDPDTIARTIIEAMKVHFTVTETGQTRVMISSKSMTSTKRKRDHESSDPSADTDAQQQLSSNTSPLKQSIAQQPIINKKTGMPKEPKRKRSQDSEGICDNCKLFDAVPFQHPFINGSMCRLCWEHKDEVRLVRFVPDTTDTEYVIFTCPIAAYIARVTVGEQYVMQHIDAKYTTQVVQECNRWKKYVYIHDEQ